MRTYQRVSASGPVEAAFNSLIFATAPLWIPVLLLYGAWAWVTSDYTPSADACLDMSKDVLKAQDAVGSATTQGDLQAAQKRLAEANKKRDKYAEACKPVPSKHGTLVTDPDLLRQLEAKEPPPGAVKRIDNLPPTEVELPDGRVITFPGRLSTKEIEGILQQIYPPTKKGRAGPWDDFKKSAPSKSGVDLEKAKNAMVAQSVASYSGRCPCPYHVKSNGASCGGSSAYSRPGGASPLCYAADISDKKAEAWCASNRTSCKEVQPIRRAAA